MTAVTAPPRAQRAAAFLVLVLGLLLSGCREIPEASSATYQPAEVTELAGLDVKQV